MSTTPDGERDVVWTITRLHAGVLAIVGGLIGGAALFVMTAWLLVKGGPHVGAHLQLLGQYFYGYSVTWVGSVVGLVWGVIVGGVIGWTIGQVYNLVVWLRQSN